MSALRDILPSAALPAGASVLDVGCGDGYTLREVMAGRNGVHLTGFDLELDSAQIAALANVSPHATWCASLDCVHGKRYDLMLLLDVLEHVDHPGAYLADLQHRFVVPKGRVLITVPAFQQLWSRHDEFLDHRRRYDRRRLLTLVDGAGLRVRRSGYLFGSLLLPRSLHVLGERLRPRRGRPAQGVGNWRWGALVTRAITLALQADNRALLRLGAAGIQLPGLTAWALCEKPA